MRYVDNVFPIIKEEDLGTILERLNKAHQNITFTVEIEQKGKLIDLNIIKKGGKFEYNVRKTTHVQRTIPFNSNHDHNQQISASAIMVIVPITKGKKNKEGIENWIPQKAENKQGKGFVYCFYKDF